MQRLYGHVLSTDEVLDRLAGREVEGAGSPEGDGAALADRDRPRADAPPRGFEHNAAAAAPFEPADSRQRRAAADRPLALESPAPALTGLTNRMMAYMEAAPA